MRSNYQLKIDEVNQKIINVKAERQRLAKQFEDQEAFKNKLKQSESVTSYEYNSFVNSSINLDLKVNQLDYELRRLVLLQQVYSALENNKSLKFTRIIIGAGAMGTAVYANIDVDERKSVSNETGLPVILALNNPKNPNQWIKQKKTLMGQSYPVQISPIFSRRPEDFSHVKGMKTKDNPYNHTVASHLADAIMISQNELDMKVLDAELVKLEKDSATNTYRLEIKLDDEVINIETEAVDICVGPGLTKKLALDQITPQLSDQLIQRGKLQYAQDNGDVTHLKGNIVIYGGGAIGGTILDDLVSRMRFDKTIRSVIWISRNAESLIANKFSNRLLKNLINKAENPRFKHFFAIGTIETIQETANNEIKINFTKTSNVENFQVLDQTSLVCDYLVVTIGQTPSEVFNTLPELDLVVEANKPLGAVSSDGKACCWGTATLANVKLTPDSNQQLGVLRKQVSEFLPPETTDTTLFYCLRSVNAMSTQLSQKKMFPKNAETMKFDTRLTPPDINFVSKDEMISILKDSVNKKHRYIKNKTYEADASALLHYRKNKYDGIQTPDDLYALLQKKKLSPKGFRILCEHFFPHVNITEILTSDSIFNLKPKTSITLFNSSDLKSKASSNVKPRIDDSKVNFEHSSNRKKE